MVLAVVWLTGIVRSFLGTLTALGLIATFRDPYLLVLLAGSSAVEILYFLFWRKKWILDSSGKPVEVEGKGQATTEWWHLATDTRKLGIFIAIFLSLPLILKICIEAVDIGGAGNQNYYSTYLLFRRPFFRQRQA